MKKSNLIIIIALAALLAGSLAVNGILVARLTKQTAQPEQTEQPPQNLYDPNHAIGADEPTTVPEVTTEPAPEQVISNPYITLVCPDDWSNRISVTTEEQENSVTMYFSASFDGKQLVLFTIGLTKLENEGFVLGELQDETAGSFYVVMNMYQQDPADWSVQDYDEICTLQELVNDIIVQFYEDPRFVPSR